jgi:hypothetical protein
MANTSLAELTAIAAAAEEPGFIPPIGIKPGGVDPLGMRQINFDLMDQVFPDLNNVTRHIRPFVVMTWAWQRANQLAQNHGKPQIDIDLLLDFVDRIDVIYVWSQFLRNPSADLPGKRVLASLLRANEWKFGGVAWRNRRRVRRYSTALTAPVNYGPSLKTLGWVQSNPDHREILIPMSAVEPALDAFEWKITDRLDHPAFNKFGSVTVTTAEVRQWSNAWALESPTRAEKEVMKEMLFGLTAPLCRQLGGALVLEAARHLSTKEVNALRKAMAGPPSRFKPPIKLLETRNAWRTVQVRQLFRLSLEALLHWAVNIVAEAPKTTEALANSLLFKIPYARRYSTTRNWLTAMRPQNSGPTDLMDEITAALDDYSFDELPRAIIRGLVFCLAEISGKENDLEQRDRLPLSRARTEADARADSTPRDFMCHVLESWVFAQHVYWSVGRGLADARAQGKKLLRLKVVLDEGGWAPAPGVSVASLPEPTRDRLETMVSLAAECGLL